MAEARNASRLQDAQVFPKLREIVEELWDCNIKEGLIKAANMIELHREHRHNFAHWAARRIGNGEALILFSKNAKASAAIKWPKNPTNLSSVSCPWRISMRRLKKLEGHGRYLAEQAAHIEQHLEDFKKAFAERSR